MVVGSPEGPPFAPNGDVSNSRPISVAVEFCGRSSGNNSAFDFVAFVCWKSLGAPSDAEITRKQAAKRMAFIVVAQRLPPL
jgi:hypothetical protein